MAAARVGIATPQVWFLSRYDRSATSIANRQLWQAIGQAPGATAYSTWYGKHTTFPAQALKAATLLEEYTLTDRGTLLSSPDPVHTVAWIHRICTNNPNDQLFLPARLLINSRATHVNLAASFAKWITIEILGQRIMADFKLQWRISYSEAPWRFED